MAVDIAGRVADVVPKPLASRAYQEGTEAPCLHPVFPHFVNAMSSEDEIEGIKRAATSDQRAMQALVSQYSPAIYALAFRMLGYPEDAEDVTQETFLRAWKALPHWKAKANFSTWLHKIALNLCYDRLRKRREHLYANPPDIPDTSLLQPETIVLGNDVQIAIETALASLPPRQRAAIVLTALQGHSQKEAATIMKLSVSALESLLARARRGLKAKLAPLKDIV